MGIADGAALYAAGYWRREHHPAREDALCLNSIQKKTPCDACGAACPQGLSIHGAQPDWRACVDCERCVAACPTQAIARSDARRRVLDAAIGSASAHATIACERYRGRADATLACLSCLSWDELAAYALRTPLAIKTSPCRECPDAASVARVREVLSQLRSFFGADEFARRVLPRAPRTPDAAREGASLRSSERRRVLASMSQTVRKGAAHLAGPPADGRSFFARAMLVDALSALPEEDRPRVHWRTLVEDGACTGCGICASMCPHGAISLMTAREAAVFADLSPKTPGTSACGDSDGYSRIARAGSFDGPEAAPAAPAAAPRFLAHDASRCTQCGLCYLSCPQDNLGGWDDLHTAALPAVRLHEIRVALCEKCGRPFKDDGVAKRCPACSRFRFSAATA